MDYAELSGYLRDDLRRANALMNSGTATDEALELYNGVVKIAKPIQSPRNRDLIAILADAHEGRYHALMRIGRKQEAENARQACAELSVLLRSKDLH